MLDAINGGYINNSCLEENTVAEWDSEDRSGLPFVAFKTTKDIAPNSELLTDYNNGYVPKNSVPFFRPVTDLRRAGCPEHLIQECKCRHNASGAHKCPKNRGYDKRDMHPADYLDQESTKRARHS